MTDDEHELAAHRMVTITASELPGNANSFRGVIYAAAMACGGSKIEVKTSDETELTIDFVVDVADDDEARELGATVLEAIQTESSFVWTVAVMTFSTSVDRGVR